MWAWASACTSARRWMKSIAGIDCSLSRKWLPTAACSTSLTRLVMVPTVEITRGVLGGEADVGLHHGALALLDAQHWHHPHRHQEGVRVVGAVEQRVVLQADAPAVVEEGLEILVV